ncbi:MAG: hypothetical protein JEZ09_13085 [Salinivirgaceae bacterium]|nr:hypothetical protein [Salinivirgaceae bacterium]
MKKIVIIFFVFCVFNTVAQVDSLKLVKYTSGFKFTEGLYLSHSMLFNNDPIPKRRIISKFNKTDFDFFDKVLDEEKITYFDQYGLKKEVKVDELWGFCRRGSIYIHWGDDFNRIPVVGNVCHFVASITTYEDRYYSPTYSYAYYNSPTTKTSKTEIHQYILDFSTGKILEYTVDNILIVLMKDAELYDEFNSFKKKKKKQMKFLFLRKFNEKHPLYVPIY